MLKILTHMVCFISLVLLLSLHIPMLTMPVTLMIESPPVDPASIWALILCHGVLRSNMECLVQAQRPSIVSLPILLLPFHGFGTYLRIFVFL